VTVKVIFVFPREERARVHINAQGVPARTQPAADCEKTLTVFLQTVSVFLKTVSV